MKHDSWLQIPREVRTHQPVVSTRQQLADLEAIADHCSELTALVSRQQEELSAALDRLGI